MKRQYIAVFFLATISFPVSAQTNVESVKLKQFSAGYNMLRILNPLNSENELPVGFIKFRVNDHAFRFSINSGFNDNNYRNKYPGLPSTVLITDSTTVNTYKYFFNSGGSVCLSIEKYQKLKVNQKLEFFIGVGITGGSSKTEEGYNYVTYLKDSTGAFHLNDSISGINYPEGKNNYRCTKVGLVPHGGLLFIPDKLFSAEFEVSAPFIYESKIPTTSASKPGSGIYFNLLFSVNLILNFDLGFKNEE